ncbi:MAG: phage portal protein [Methylobacterium sp.]|nr:phage portal protein [Methylobacterium sp.]MCA3652036.1 phage portal protein [Methylobacterium sp.]
MTSILSRLLGRQPGPEMRAPERKQGLPMLAFHHPGRGLFGEASGVALVRAGFHRNPVVHRCVRLIAESAANVPLALTVDGAEVTDHALEKLLDRPNPRESGISLLDGVFTHLLLFGNAYLHLLTDGETAPLEIHALRPDRVRVVAGPDGWPRGYEYSLGAARSLIAIEPEGLQPILHLRLADPLDDHQGYAPLCAAQVPLEMHEAASRWNKALLDNSARPSGALVYASPENLTDLQFDRLKAELEQAFSGQSNAGRPILLEGGLDWKPLALTPKDMDFQEARNGAAREIALAFGVPPLLLGLPGDNTYSNYAEANRAFWRQTIVPLVRRVSGAMAQWLQPAHAGRITLLPDLDQIEAIAEDRSALWKRVAEASFLTDQEKRNALGYGAKAKPRAPRP